MIEPMTSKILLSTTGPLLLGSLLIVLAVPLGGCDSKNDGEGADVANLADSSRDQAKTEQEGASDSAKVERTSASSPGGATVAKQAPLEASLYFDQHDIPRLSKRAQVESSALVGKEASPSYGSVRIHVPSDDDFGAALQLWKLDEDKPAEAEIERMRDQYLGVKDAPKNAPVRREKAFLSTRAGITTYVFAAKGKSAGFVAAVSCGERVCPNGWSDVSRLSKTVFERIRSPEALEKAVEQRQDLAQKAKERAEDKREQRKEPEERKKTQKK
jgi:ribosomal protein S19E (S16A)